jgi:hypothetical protein
VLVHGAWHGAWCWSRVGDRLTAAGHTAVAVELPSDEAGAGRGRYVTAVGEAVAAHPGAVVVAHSMAGLVAPYATEGAAALVMLAAMVPTPGEAWVAAGAEPYAATMRRLTPRMHVESAGLTWWDRADAVTLLYHDCPPADAEDAVARMRPDSAVVYTEIAPELPSTPPTVYVGATADRALDAAWNAQRARLVLDAPSRALPTGHSPFWSSPATLTELLVDVAAGTAAPARGAR